VTAEEMRSPGSRSLRPAGWANGLVADRLRESECRGPCGKFRAAALA